MLFESLEDRRLMSVSLNVASGLLTVQGKDDWMNTDVITAKVQAGQLKVNDNGIVHSFPVASVKKIAIYARKGADTVKLDATVNIPSFIDSGAGHPAGGTGDYIQGGSGKDTILLKSSFSTAYGGGNADVLENHGGYNKFYGEAGNDRLVNKHGGTSESGWDGGSGVDTMDYSAHTENMVLRNGVVGWYYPDTTPPVVAGPGADSVANCENFFAGKGDDYIYGTSAANILKGNAGNDVIRGGDGNDAIYGGTGEDALFGEAGNDSLFSKDGIKDFLSGGSGTDSGNKDAIDIINSVEVVS